MVSNHEPVMFCVLTNTYSQLQGKSPFVAQPYTVAYNKSYFASILTFVLLFYILLCIIVKSHVIKPTAMFFLCKSICLLLLLRSSIRLVRLTALTLLKRSDQDYAP